MGYSEKQYLTIPRSTQTGLLGLATRDAVSVVEIPDLSGMLG